MLNLFNDRVKHVGDLVSVPVVETFIWLVSWEAETMVTTNNQFPGGVFRAEQSIVGEMLWYFSSVPW